MYEDQLQVACMVEELMVSCDNQASYDTLTQTTYLNYVDDTMMGLVKKLTDPKGNP